MSDIPQMPKHFTPIEQKRMLAHLDYANSLLRPYAGDWTAYWLPVPIDADYWPLLKPNSRKAGEIWKDVIGVNWNFLLPDGSHFGDEKNKRMKDFCQKIAFLVRELPGSAIQSSISHWNFIQSFQLIIYSLYLNRELYDPAQHGLSRIDSAAIMDFAALFKKDGAIGVMRYHERFLKYLYRAAIGKDVARSRINDIYNVPTADRDKIIKWMKSEGFYEVHRRKSLKKSEHIGYTKVAAVLSTDVSRLKSKNFQAFLRQFEPDMLALSPDLLIGRGGLNTAKFSHRVPEIAAVSRGTRDFHSMENMAGAWRALLQPKLYAHFPDFLPRPGVIRSADVKAAFSAARRPKHTPWMPLLTALTYNKEALRVVVMQLKYVVDFYLKGLEFFKEHGMLIDTSQAKSLRDKWVVENCPPELTSLNINCWAHACNSPGTLFSREKDSPSVHFLLEVSIGATIHILTVLKPMRAEEVVALKKNCIQFVKGDGYWVSHIREKDAHFDLRPEIARPIPTIVATSLSHIRRLSEGLANLTDNNDKQAEQYLFYVPHFRAITLVRAEVLTPGKLTACLARFCDMVNLPEDSSGQRWYIKTHENRKEFLMTFFWCFSNSGLDAAAWMAGHGNSNDILQYIETNFPGEQIPRGKASYLAAQLWDFASTRKNAEVRNIEELYHAVCQHFHIRELALVQKEELEAWLEMAVKKGLYRIALHYISTEKGSDKAMIFVEISNRKIGGGPA